jgi:hypothetical protein
MDGSSVRTSAPVIDELTWQRSWVLSFGDQWRLDIFVMALVVFLFGAVRPLSDPDLPMHLALGEWIVSHRAVPMVEPFSWTRAGSPYYAYSWLPESLYYLVLRTFGHVGLRALQGLMVVGAAASTLVLAQVAKWRASQGVILAGMNLIVGAFFVAMLRPQSVLLITLPLIWAGFLMVCRGDHLLRPALLIFVASAVTANSHLFFPLTLAPAVLLLVTPPRRHRHAIAGVAAVLCGWFASPYGTHWFQVFHHNFAPNILVRPPSAVTELQPGFVTMLYPSPTAMLALVATMLAIPWILAHAPLSRHERLLSGAYWGVGIILFGYAARLFVAWWLLSLLPVGWAIVHLTRSSEEAPPRLGVRLLGLAACALLIGTEFAKTRNEWALEGDTVRRTLPTVVALPAERIARVIQRHAEPPAGTRMMSTFALGSYLTWRLPRYSQSIDSRGVFPDSVLAAEAVVLASDRDVPLGPWKSADLALMPVRYRSAAVLDTASGWRRELTVAGDPEPTDSVGLWLRNSWRATYWR